jgi:hypothetical protein
LTFGQQDHCPLVPLGPSALLHRVPDGGRRLDGAELDTVDLDAPLSGCLIEDHAQLLIDLLATGQRLLEIKSTDDVAQRGHGQLLDCLDVVLSLVRAPVPDR